MSTSPGDRHDREEDRAPGTERPVGRPGGAGRTRVLLVLALVALVVIVVFASLYFAGRGESNDVIDGLGPVGGASPAVTDVVAAADAG